MECNHVVTKKLQEDVHSMMAAAGEAERLNSYRNWAGFWVLGTINNLGKNMLPNGSAPCVHTHTDMHWVQVMLSF